MSRPRSRRALPAVALALAVVLLSACGARIDTRLTVDSSGSGQRVMTLTLDSDQDSVLGGVDALDASIRRHKPDVIDYSGISAGPEGEWIATFTVTFADPEEYREKMIALLAASDQSWSQENVFVVEESMFVSGASIDETFDSADLLEWMFAGLVADGVVDESDEGNMRETGETTVVYDGVTYENYSPITFSEMTDRGFDSVEMETVLGADGYQRTITYWVDDKAVYTSIADRFDGFFEGLEPAGITVEKDTAGAGVTWVATFSAEDAEDLADLTRGALWSESSEFEVTVGPLPDDPATFSMQVLDYAECSTICSPEAGAITDTLIAPEGYEVSSGHVVDEDGNVTLHMDVSGEPVEYQVVHLFESVSAELSIGMGGDLTWRADFVAGPAMVEAVGVGLAELLAWADGEGTVGVAESDEGTTYSVTVTGGDVDAFLESFEAWSGDRASLVKEELDGASVFAEHYRLTGDLALPSALDRHVRDGDLQTSISVPFGQSIDADESWPEALDGDGYRFSGTTFAVTVGGTSLAGFVIYGNLALLLLAAVVVLVVFRRRIGGAMARRREAAAARRAEAAAAAGVAPGAPAAPAPPTAEGAPVPGAPALAPPTGAPVAPAPSLAAVGVVEPENEADVL